MRLLCLIVAGTMLILQCSAQSTEKAPLRFSSYAFNLCVNKNEQLVIVTRAGEAAMATSPQSYWKKANPGQTDKMELFSPGTFEQANFFNNDTGFISGFINNGKGAYNIIYRTVDGGHNWVKIDFGKGGWVDDATNLDDGEAWMSVSGGGIEYTSDYGVHWENLSIPEPKQRFAKIYFNNKREGIIGSLWNMLAYTVDNCSSWKIIPTPLDQKKYTKLNSGNRPEINRVAIFGNYFLVCQEGLVFCSRRDSIDWIPLKGYIDFYTDAGNSALFGKTAGGDFLRLNKEMKPEFTYQVSTRTYDAKCRNGHLFVMCGEKIMDLQRDNAIALYPINTNEATSIEPETIGYANDGFYGVVGNEIYIQKDFKGDWKYQFTLPFDVDTGHLSFVNSKTILYQQLDSLYYYDLDFGSVQYKSAHKMLAEFCNSSIRKIAFNKGSRGCFHYYYDELVYTPNVEGEFVLQEKESGKQNGLKPFLSGNESSFDKQLVADFMKQVPSIAYKMANIDELGFSEDDYERCKQDIRAFQTSLDNKKKAAKQPFQFYVNNLDFGKLLTVVDSLRSIDPGRLNNMLLQLDGGWSTTTNWTKIVFTNLLGDELTIANNYYEHNALNFPWTIMLNGVVYPNTSIEINQFIGKVYPGFLDQKAKMDVLYKLVKAIYKERAARVTD